MAKEEAQQNVEEWQTQPKETRLKGSRRQKSARASTVLLQTEDSVVQKQERTVVLRVNDRKMHPKWSRLCHTRIPYPVREQVRTQWRCCGGRFRILSVPVSFSLPRPSGFGCGVEKTVRSVGAPLHCISKRRTSITPAYKNERTEERVRAMQAILRRREQEPS